MVDAQPGRMRKPRRLRPGTWMLSCRTFHERFLLRPSPRVNEIILGVIGRAQKKYPGILLHAFVFLSNHYHMLVTIESSGELSPFMRYVQGNIARKVGREHGWSQKFWSKRFDAIEVLDDAAVLEQLGYVIAQGTKEGLVRSPEDWPGVTTTHALLYGTPLVGYWFDGTSASNARRSGSEEKDPYAYAERVVVTLAPIPQWKKLAVAEQRRRVRQIVASVEEFGRKTHRNFMGPEKVLKQKTHDRPDHCAFGPIPPCLTTDFALWMQYVWELGDFVIAYRVASTRYRSGECTSLTEFPMYSFPPAAPLRKQAA